MLQRVSNAQTMQQNPNLGLQTQRQQTLATLLPSTPTEAGTRTAMRMSTMHTRGRPAHRWNPGIIRVILLSEVHKINLKAANLWEHGDATSIA